MKGEKGGGCDDGLGIVLIKLEIWGVNFELVWILKLKLNSSYASQNSYFFQDSG